MRTRLAVAAIVGLCAVLLLPAGVGLAGEVPGPDYVISPGDALQIEVWGEETLSKTYPVGPVGTINMPQVGQVSLADLTVDQAQQVLTKRLGALLRSPHVTLSVNETLSLRKVYVLGFVATQGPVELHFGAEVVDALAAAGTTELSDLAHVQLTHPAATPLTLDFTALRTGGGSIPSEKVRWGDVIYVPRVEQRIAVFGQVRTPGSYVLPLGQKVTILEALAGVGGGLTEDAAAAQATLVRSNGQVLPVDLDALLKRGDTTQNLEMAPGDVLVVPQVENISIVGEVFKPISFRISQPISVLEALAQAGNFTPEADLTRAQVISPGGQVRNVNLKALWEQGDQTQNVRMASGDVLVIPKRAPENLLMVGAVAKPGVFDLAEVQQRDILRLFTAAGQVPESDLSRVQVYRGSERLVVNLQAVMDGDLSQNMQLQPDDVVMVPEKAMIYVFGAVNRQGKVPWDSKLTFLDAISEVGGLAPRANENGTMLVHTQADGTTETINVRLGDLKKGVNPQSVSVEAGDIIYVPQLGQPGAMWSALQNILWLTGTVVGLTR